MNHDTFDIERAIQSMRNNKALDKDHISIKLCKKGGQTLINMLHSLNKTLCIGDKVPMEWKTNIRAQYIKTRATNYSQNYKGISLFCTEYTVLTIVLNNILKKYTNNKIGECQAGIRVGKSIKDQIFMCKICWKKPGNTRQKYI
jgi:hypothetical protein